MVLPENISRALDMLESAGHEAWVVGGCVRDSLMGIIPHDYDITTSALPAETEPGLCGIPPDRDRTEARDSHGACRRLPH